MSYLFAILLTLALLAYVGLPLFRRPAPGRVAAPRHGAEPPRRGPVEELEGGLAANREELAELERERAAGRITEADHRQLAGRLEQECRWVERELAEARRGGRKGRGGSIDERIDEELRKLAAARAAESGPPAAPGAARPAGAGGTSAPAVPGGSETRAACGAPEARTESDEAAGGCPSCGAANPAGFNFCGRCGAPLAAAGGGGRRPT